MARKGGLGPEARCFTCQRYGDFLCPECMHWFCRADWVVHGQSVCDRRQLDPDNDVARPRPPAA